MCDALHQEYKTKKYDCILCLGDYSLDFWNYEIGGSYLHTPPMSYTDKFMKTYYPNFPTECYMIPGNHEQYGAKKWKDITGFEREYCLIYGEYIFIMLDTFSVNLDPTENSDGVYSGVNAEFIQYISEKYQDKKIILFAHYFDPKKESKETQDLIIKNTNIQCIFVGHRHISTTVFLDETWRNFPVFFCGNFSYHRSATTDSSDYYGDIFFSIANNKKIEWGYRILDLQGGMLRTDYIHI